MLQAVAWAVNRWRDLLLTEEPTDMDWTPGPDGQPQAWFFEDTDAQAGALRPGGRTRSGWNAARRSLRARS